MSVIENRMRKAEKTMEEIENHRNNTIDQKSMGYEAMEQLQELNKLLLQMNQMQGVQTINMVQSYFQIMEAQYNSINQELKNINEKLNNMQYPQTPQKRMQHNRLKELANTLDQSVEKIPVQISQMKQDICQKATGVINDFKARGVLALNNIAGKLGIKDMLINTKAKFDVEAEKIQKTIDKFNALDNEINEVKIHTKNIGNIISGKELLESSKQEKGLFTPLKNMYSKVMKFYTSNSDKVHDMIVNIEKLEIDALNAGDHIREQKQRKSINNSKKSVMDKLNINKEKLQVNSIEQKDSSNRLLSDKQLENKDTSFEKEDIETNSDNMLPDEKSNKETKKFSEISNLANSENWKNYLNTASGLYMYSFKDQLLIHAQRPDATVCASLDMWNKKMDCWVDKGSKSITLIDNNNELNHVFDISDTHIMRGRSGSEPYLWKMKEEHKSVIKKHLDKMYSTEKKEGLIFKIKEVADIFAEKNYKELALKIKNCNTESNIEKLDKQDMEAQIKETIANSIEYTVLKRCGVDDKQLSNKISFAHIHNFNTEKVLAELGNTISDCSKNILKDIGKTIKEYDKVVTKDFDTIYEEDKNADKKVSTLEKLETLKQETKNNQKSSEITNKQKQLENRGTER